MYNFIKQRILNGLMCSGVCWELNRRGKYMLSGLLYCGKCGYSLQFQLKPNGYTLVEKCQKADSFGNPCGNRGIELEHVEKAVIESLREHEAELLKTLVEIPKSDFPAEHLLHTKERELESLRDNVKIALNLNSLFEHHHQMTRTNRMLSL